MNNKYYNGYKKVFDSLCNLLTDNNNYELKITTITTDFEQLYIVQQWMLYQKKKKIQLIGCLFHYKEALLRKLKELYGYKKSKIISELKVNIVKKKKLITSCNVDDDFNIITKEKIDILVDRFGRLPFLYNGDTEVIDNCVEIHKKKHKIYFFL